MVGAQDSVTKTPPCSPSYLGHSATTHMAGKKLHEAIETSEDGTTLSDRQVESAKSQELSSRIRELEEQNIELATTKDEVLRDLDTANRISEQASLIYEEKLGGLKRHLRKNNEYTTQLEHDLTSSQNALAQAQALQVMTQRSLDQSTQVIRTLSKNSSESASSDSQGLQVKLAEIETQLQFINQDLIESNTKNTHLKTQNAQLEKQLSEAKSALAEETKEKTKFAKTILVMEEDYTKEHSELEQKKNQLLCIERHVQALEQQTKTLQQSLNSISATLTQFQAQIESYMPSFDGMIQALSERTAKAGTKLQGIQEQLSSESTASIEFQSDSDGQNSELSLAHKKFELGQLVSSPYSVDSNGTNIISCSTSESPSPRQSLQEDKIHTQQTHHVTSIDIETHLREVPSTVKPLVFLDLNPTTMKELFKFARDMNFTDKEIAAGYDFPITTGSPEAKDLTAIEDQDKIEQQLHEIAKKYYPKDTKDKKGFQKKSLRFSIWKGAGNLHHFLSFPEFSKWLTLPQSQAVHNLSLLKKNGD